MLVLFRVRVRTCGAARCVHTVAFPLCIDPEDSECPYCLVVRVRVGGCAALGPQTECSCCLARACAQVACGKADATGEPCPSAVCLQKIVAHYVASHAARFLGYVNADVLADGSKSVRVALSYFTASNDRRWFPTAGLKPYVFRTAMGGCFVLDFYCCSFPPCSIFCYCLYSCY